MAHISLIVRLIYDGKKALNIATDANEGIRILWEDLRHLKIPQPKRENTTTISNETIGGPRGYEFFWPMVQQFGPLHNTLIIHITEAKSIVSHQKLLRRLSIASLSYEEVAVPKEKALKRKASLIERDIKPKFHHLQWIRLPDAPVHTTIGSSSNDDEALILLDEVASSLNPYKRLKLEPVEPSLADSPHRGDSIASSRPSPARPPPASSPLKSTSPQMVMNSDAAIPMSIPSSDQPSPVPLPASPPFLLPPTAQNDNHKPSPTPPGLTLHSRIGPPSPPTSRSRSHSHSFPTRKRTPDPSPSRLRIPKPDDVPKIQKLTRELWDLRRQVTAGVARETTILNELKELNSPPIPESSTRLKSNDELMIKTRLQMVEQELKQERRRRVEAETTLKDIERECREPFVVPALLDAFVTISKITSQAMDQDTKA